MVGGITLVILTFVRERPLPDVNALLIPAIVLAVAGSVWAAAALRLGESRQTPRGPAGVFVGRFTHPREWSGLTQRSRLAFGCIGIASFIVAGSSNPSLGGYHNNPSLPRCSSGLSGKTSCVSYALHLHTLAAQQRFYAAIFVGVITFVLGVALSTAGRLTRMSGVAVPPQSYGQQRYCLVVISTEALY